MVPKVSVKEEAMAEEGDVPIKEQIIVLKGMIKSHKMPRRASKRRPTSKSGMPSSSC